MPECAVRKHVAVTEQVDAADRYEAGPDENMQKAEAEDNLEEQAGLEADVTAADTAETEVV